MKTKRFLPLLLLPTFVACQSANQTGQSAVEGAQAHLEAGKEQAQSARTQAEAAATGRIYIEMLDPVGDDDGPGTYIYPTDPVYTPGSFDITKFEVEEKGDHVEFRVTVNAKIEDPWDSRAWQGNGFSVQMAQIYIDMDHQPESGIRQALPGMNVTFVPESYWERCIIISPQGPNRVNSEINEKAAQWKAQIIVPQVTRAAGRTLIAVVGKDQLGAPPSRKWGYQVLMQSNEGFPDKTDLLTRKVNEYEGQHRFGGGNDYDSDPHVIDILVSPARGGKDEIERQHAILGAYKNLEKPTIDDLVALPMVYLE